MSYRHFRIIHWGIFWTFSVFLIFLGITLSYNLKEAEQSGEIKAMLKMPISMLQEMSVSQI